MLLLLQAHIALIIQNQQYVGRSSKQNQQKVHIQECAFELLKTQQNQRLNVHTNQNLAQTFGHGTLDSIVF